MKKHCILFLFALALATIACNKKNDNDTLEAATITKHEFGYCLCCGGYSIEIQGVVYRFEEPPIDSKIDLLTSPKPLAVKVRWQPKPERCKDDVIDILEIVPN